MTQLSWQWRMEAKPEERDLAILQETKTVLKIQADRVQAVANVKKPKTKNTYTQGARPLPAEQRGSPGDGILGTCERGEKKTHRRELSTGRWTTTPLVDKSS